MVDFHTHILPGLDDGSKSTRESLEMLRMERRQGIDTVVLTPHYYSSQNSPEAFLRRRQLAWEQLAGSLEEGMPRLLLGAEVQYFENMGNVEHLDVLCIQKTKLLLLEMPFCHWDERVIRTVLELNGSNGLQIVLAHIERYLSFPQNAQALELLRRSGILMQVNASFFEGWLRCRKAVSMLKRGAFHLIGSDCHNTSSRCPNWELVPEDVVRTVDRFSKALLRQSAIK
ncbi:MAG: CpsB/CapC family capsule biosynthesis tyrosine phosphatase [Faecousia sp.]